MTTYDFTVILDPDCPPGQIMAHPTWNRWAAFTDEELEAIVYPVVLPALDHLIDEAEAEIERRIELAERDESEEMPA